MSARSWIAIGVVLAAVTAACNVFGPAKPDGFDGWFHLDGGTDRAISIRFDEDSVFELRNYGCTNPEALQFTWQSAGTNSLVVPDLGSSPVFTSDGQGNLTAAPGIFTSNGAPETWVTGGLCFFCGADGGAFACDVPSMRDAGP